MSFLRDRRENRNKPLVYKGVETVEASHAEVHFLYGPNDEVAYTLQALLPNKKVWFIARGEARKNSRWRLIPKSQANALIQKYNRN